MRKSLMVTAMAAVLVLLACGAASSDSDTRIDPHGVVEKDVKLRNGRTVICLFWNPDTGYDSAMECDWANAR